MGKVTFVVEFEDGKEPPVHANMEVFGGKVVAVAFRDALEESEYQRVKYDYDPHKINVNLCYLCNRYHPIGVACPFNTITSGVSNE
ncbi:hypothetical protein GR294_24500 [Raoultella sp. Lac2]|uniref:hypothetical protein n=1 Tax=unclassified Raoultella TaxID=2627600 RepID=UPI0013557F9E|nr:hypothetical protein [Raoultella sp. Lac2]MXF99278.1 hypothetical protein [Raoultella sp. Lac1]